MIVRGAFNHLLRPGLRRDFRDSYDQHPEEFNRILKEGSQDRAEVEATALSGLPQMIQRGEAEPITYMDPVMSDKVTFVDDEYALGFIVSRRMMEDDLYGKARQNAKWLGRSARLAQEFLAASLVDDAFAGSVFTGLEAESLIDSSHTFINSDGNWSNQVAGDPQLGVTGLQAMFELAEGLQDHNADPIPSTIDTLVIGPADEWAAIQLTQSELEPFTSDNQVNAIRRKKSGLDYVVSHYKATSNRHWFGRDDQLHDAHFLFRIRPMFEDSTDDDTLAAKFIGRQRINVYFFDPRGWFGSQAT